MPIDDIAQIKWPVKDGEHRVVQFYVDDRPYLRFGSLHADIVKSFAEEFEAGTRRIYSPHGPIWYFKDEERFQLAGMGFCKYSPTEKKAVFGGESKSYGKSINKDHLRLIKEVCPEIKLSYKPNSF